MSTLEKKFICDACQDSYEDEKGRPCQECCPHYEYDHGICEDCGADRYDTLAARAEAAFEEDR